MTREEFDRCFSRQLGAALPGAGELDAWKVGGKMFASFAHSESRSENTQTVSVECPDIETDAMFVDAGATRKAPYFHRSWVQLESGPLDLAEAEHRVAVSYDIIAQLLSESLRETL